MKIKEGMTCYFCGKKAVSSEHVPPRCFFPKDRRENLIQVPACEEHNESTSKDDEYVLFFISSNIGNNMVGKEHSIKKGIKPVQYSEALAKVLAENSINIFVNNDGKMTSTKMIKLDRNRFDKEMTKMAFALFYHTYQRRWERELNIGTNCLICADGKTEDLGIFIESIKSMMAETHFDEKMPFSGSNKEVFKYRFMESENPDEPILQMIFYEGFEVWAFVKKLH